MSRGGIPPDSSLIPFAKVLGEEGDVESDLSPTGAFDDAALNEPSNLERRGLQFIYQDKRLPIFGSELAAQLHESLLGAFGCCRVPL